MGQTEAPLTIRPYLPRMTESELMTVMTSGMAHISGGIMAAYILFGIEAQHLLTAVVRAERFSEGSLEWAFQSGLMAAIARRARTLADGLAETPHA